MSNPQISELPAALKNMRKRRANPEEQLQRAVMQFLDYALGGAAVAFHVPNGGSRSKAEGGRFKAMGVLAGLPDIGIVDGGNIFWLELKSPHGRLSEAQRATIKRLNHAKCPVRVCRSIDEVAEALTMWGIATRLSPSLRRPA